MHRINRIQPYDIPDCERRYRLLAEHLRDCVWLYDLKKQRFAYISPAIVHFTGVPAAQAMRQRLEDMLTPSSCRRLKAMAHHFTASTIQPPLHAAVTRAAYMHSDGRTVEAEVSLRLAVEGTPPAAHLLCVSRDIGGQMAKESKLREEIRLRDQTIRRLQRSLQRLSAMVSKQTEKYDALNSIATRDELTGLANRHYFNQKVSVEMARTDRYASPLSIVLFDLDHFKHVNDTYGHAVGDQVLANVAHTVSPIVREPDVLARWGGEEFVVLMPQTSLPSAFLMAERLRMELERLAHPIAGQVTASFGVAQRLERESFDNWYNQADQALYAAKERGRNRTVSAPPPQSMLHVSLQWQAEWESGHEQIDAQHRSIFAISDQIAAAIRSSVSPADIMPLLAQLSETILAHLPVEEQLQERIGFPDYELHALEHRRLVDKMAVLERNCLSGDLPLVAFWSFLLEEVVVGHILKKDMQYFAHMDAPQKRGDRQ